MLRQTMNMPGQLIADSRDVLTNLLPPRQGIMGLLVSEPVPKGVLNTSTQSNKAC